MGGLWWVLAVAIEEWIPPGTCHASPQATRPTPWRPPLKDLLLTVLGTHPSLWWGIHTTPPRASDERRSHATHIFQHMLAAKELMNFTDSAFHPRCYHREMQTDEGR